MTVSILTVDDEADIAELFRQHFRREVRQGLYTLHFADSAEEALQMLAGGIRPQLIVILSDINMPGMDGLSLLREVKKSRPEMPVMMVTAYGDDERRRRAPRTRCCRIAHQAGRLRLAEGTAAAVAHRRRLTDPGSIESGRFLRSADPPIRLEQGPEWGRDRDRGTPRGAAPPTPPGIRVRTTAVRSG
jgi:CheY-like chemotaxis protein